MFEKPMTAGEALLLGLIMQDVIHGKNRPMQQHLEKVTEYERKLELHKKER